MVGYDCVCFGTKNILWGKNYNLPLRFFLFFPKVGPLILQTSLEEAEETTTTSVDKVATWESHVTSGKVIIQHYLLRFQTFYIWTVMDF